MLPTRKTMAVRLSAGVFGLAAALSLWNGTTEWTAAFRGLIAAIACALLVPPIYGPLRDSWLESQQNAAAAARGAGGTRP
jgi:hypothetical protein